MIAVGVLTGQASGTVSLTVAHTGTGDDPANATTYTFSAMAIGAADSTRQVIAAVGIRSTNAIGITSVTIGGVTATVDLSQTGTDNSAQTLCLIARASVPTGTTADVVVVLSGSSALRALASAHTIVGGSVVVSGTASSGATGSQSLTPATGRITIAAAAQGSANSLTISSGAVLSATQVSSETANFRIVSGRSTTPGTTVVIAQSTYNAQSCAVSYSAA